LRAHHHGKENTASSMLLRRQDLEAAEIRNLAPYAERSAASRGRRNYEASDPLRTAFSRDRDRVVHSSAYRRLGNKTQVFITLEGEYFRTRLTHTEEAVQIALTIARTLGLNLDLTEAICRAHDLGHAPFGHAGETILSECMAEDGGFEHNAQTLRIVDLLEDEYPGIPGLNLTWEVREGIAKHGNHRLPGPEQEFAGLGQPSLEAQVSDMADGIAYGCHDLDDGLAAGLIRWEEFDDLRPAWWLAVRTEILQRTAALTPDLARRFLKRYLVNILVNDAVAITAARLEELSPSSADDIRAHEAVVAFSPQMRALRESLHEYLTTALYRHHLVETMWVKAQRLIRALFESYVTNPAQLPPLVEKRVGPGCSLKRAVCDYVAEMTDRAAVREYHRLYEFDIQVLP
jgi:dGTPase